MLPKFRISYDDIAPEADTQPGNYYVSAIENPQDPGSRWWPMLGPFGSQQEALDRVEEVRRFANEKEPRSFWFAFGTVRMADDYNKPGNANKYLMPDAA